jgi:hypothetical protein
MLESSSGTASSSGTSGSVTSTTGSAARLLQNRGTRGPSRLAVLRQRQGSAAAVFGVAELFNSVSEAMSE